MSKSGTSKYSKLDLHEGNISSERFWEIVKEYRIKIDEGKYNIKQVIDGMLNDPNIRASIEHKYVQVYSRLPEENNDELDFKKNTTEQLFVNMVLYEANKTIEIEISREIVIEKENMKAYLDKMEKYKEQKEAAARNHDDIALQAMQAKQRDETNQFLNDFKANLDKRLGEYQRQLDDINMERERLKTLKKDTYKFYGGKIVADLADIKTRDGKSIFDGMSPDQQAELGAKMLEKFDEAMIKAKQDPRYVELDNKINAKQNRINELQDKINSASSKQQSKGDPVTFSFANGNTSQYAAEQKGLQNEIDGLRAEQKEIEREYKTQGIQELFEEEGLDVAPDQVEAVVDRMDNNSDVAEAMENTASIRECELLNEERAHRVADEMDNEDALFAEFEAESNMPFESSLSFQDQKESLLNLHEKLQNISVKQPNIEEKSSKAQSPRAS